MHPKIKEKILEKNGKAFRPARLLLCTYPSNGFLSCFNTLLKTAHTCKNTIVNTRKAVTPPQKHICSLVLHIHTRLGFHPYSVTGKRTCISM